MDSHGGTVSQPRIHGTDMMMYSTRGAKDCTRRWVPWIPDTEPCLTLPPASPSPRRHTDQGGLGKGCPASRAGKWSHHRKGQEPRRLGFNSDKGCESLETPKSERDCETCTQRSATHITCVAARCQVRGIRSQGSGMRAQGVEKAVLVCRNTLVGGPRPHPREPCLSELSRCTPSPFPQRVALQFW